MSSVPDNPSSSSPAASSGRWAIRAAMAVSATLSADAASCGSSAPASRSMACASAPSPSEIITCAADRRPGPRPSAGAAASSAIRRRRRCIRTSAGSAAKSKRLVTASSCASRLAALGSVESARPAPPPDSTNPSCTGRKATTSLIASAATPCQVGMSKYSTPRRTEGTPCPGWRCVPTSSVAPVSGSARLTTRPGVAARSIRRPSLGIGRIGRSFGSFGTIVMRQTCSDRDRETDLSGSRCRRITVSVGIC
jgi:hypothetical protein